MDYRLLGRTGVSVSPLCLGSMMFGPWGNGDRQESTRIIHRAVAQAGWRGGIYVEANAIAPQRTRHIAELLGGSTVVDGAVVGPPPTGGKSPVLCLAGDGAAVATVADLFFGTDVRIKEVAGELGAASALKLAYAGFNKAACVLAAISHAVAAEHGVQQHLLDLARPAATSPSPRASPPPPPRPGGGARRCRKSPPSWRPTPCPRRSSTPWMRR